MRVSDGLTQEGLQLLQQALEDAKNRHDREQTFAALIALGDARWIMDDPEAARVQYRAVARPGRATASSLYGSRAALSPRCALWRYRPTGERAGIFQACGDVVPSITRFIRRGCFVVTARIPPAGTWTEPTGRREQAARALPVRTATVSDSRLPLLDGSSSVAVEVKRIVSSAPLVLKATISPEESQSPARPSRHAS